MKVSQSQGFAADVQAACQKGLDPEPIKQMPQEAQTGLRQLLQSGSLNYLDGADGFSGTVDGQKVFEAVLYGPDNTTYNFAVSGQGSPIATGYCEGGNSTTIAWDATPTGFDGKPAS
jgi:hypothetical protein